MSRLAAWFGHGVGNSDGARAAGTFLSLMEDEISLSLALRRNVSQ